MKCVRIFLRVFFSALVIAPGACIARSPSTVAATAPVALRAEFRPGETVRYTFLQKMNLTTRLNPRMASHEWVTVIPHQCQIEGEVVATFAPTQPGEPLRGTVQFQGLTVKNWVSSANVADLEARLRQLEAAPLTLTTAADGDFELSGGPTIVPHDPYSTDVITLENTARAALISRISSQPLAPGQRRESADFPGHGLVSSGIKLTTLTEYITDVPIAGHPSAEVRLSLNVPNQPVPSSLTTSGGPQQSQLEILLNVQNTGVLTYLLDLDAHQISFVHETGHAQLRFGVKSTDTNAPVRIPVNLVTVNADVETTTRRAVASASPEREADLAAFEESLAAPPSAASGGSGATATASPGAEVSLGDLARRVRSERAAQGPPPAEITLSGSSAAVKGVPPGFKQATFPNGDMIGLVPVQASEGQRTSNEVDLVARLDTPRTVVVISMVEVNIGPVSSPDDIFDRRVKALQARAGARVLHSERKSINGEPGVVVEFQLDVQGQPFQQLEADVLSGGKAFATICGTVPADFPKVESLCRTVVESIGVR